VQRRAFIRDLAWGGTLLAVAPRVPSTATPAGAPKISLAQWSLNRAFFGGDLDPEDFAAIAMNTYGIDAVEYVSAFYVDSVLDESFWKGLKARASDAGVRSLLIMVDDEGDLGAADDAVRRRAVENHHKWVDAARILDCHSIRVNAFGDPERETFRQAMVDGMGRLAEYAAAQDLNILIENHGLFSSDAGLITGIIREVGMPNLGTLPDFGNWCLSAKWGTTQFECDEVYDRYRGVEEFLPYARGVSAKAYDFDERGEDRIIDYRRMLKLVKDSGYDGYIGIEYEGAEKPEHEGILLTRALIERVWPSLP
jgi:sugar phosphate isomerase/epimerase